MNTRSFSLLAVMLVAALLPVAALAQEESADDSPRPTIRRGQQVIILRDIEIDADEIVGGQVVVIGGHAKIRGDVRDQVVVVAGSVEIEGAVSAETITVLSDVRLADGARLHGGLINILGTLEEGEDVVIRGQNINIAIPFAFSLGRFGFGVLSGAFAAMVLSFSVITFLTIVLLALLTPHRILNISETVPVRLAAAYLMGALAYILELPVKLLLIVLLAATVVGSPLIFLVPVFFFVLRTLGLAGVLHYLGQRIGVSLGREMSLLGAVLITLVPLSLLLVLPFLFGGWGLMLGLILHLAVGVLIKLPAYGLAILTRAGGRGPAVPPAAPPVPAAPAPPPEPAVG